ncbi:MAG: hypothetical protein JWQ87_505 [Candidatus Sulfotelmatobacter sp.]|nr:hypothetical protein [Candidatus Sulfotelmatobacter sp.]
MDSTRTTAAATGKLTPPVIQPENAVRSSVRNDVRNDLRNAVRNDVESPRQFSGYGLPCANCRLYYPANLDSCPACNSKERVSASIVPIIPPVQAATEILPENAVEQDRVELEREEFLKQFKSQLVAAHSEASNSPTVCSLGEHGEEPESASICKPCYERLQERVDVFEAALHIDLKEAAQIVYDAVWADPSDPSKTYTNAASALITELRRRSGVSSMLGPFHPLGN